MAMVISTRAKLVITALILFFLLGIVLVTGSTKGWFNPNRYNGERVAARIQVYMQYTKTNKVYCDKCFMTTAHFALVEHTCLFRLPLSPPARWRRGTDGWAVLGDVLFQSCTALTLFTLTYGFGSPSPPPFASPLSSLKTVIKLILCRSEAGRGRIQGYRRGFAENEETARGEAIKNHLKHSKCRMRMGEVKVDKR
uniref:HDC08846 n=1 Tax=Drosophila melanogaster TaxID=7227 RepID=Q6ILN7_DROME|nr:TPA_inf: HDC08846 [Drosophila melanogaster]